MRVYCVSLILLAVFVFQVYAQTPKTPAKELKSKTYRYLLYLPDNYKEKEQKKWPLIIYLHGKSACGNNLDKVRRYGLPFFMDRDMKLEAIVVAPQCPEGKNWVAENWFMPFLDDLRSNYDIDKNRIYLTGMSLGGFGTFSLAIKYPEVFAATAPLCGGGQPTTACPMKDIPTWVFHGDRDEQVPLSRSTEMVNALKKCGGHPKYSILKGQPHDIHRTYGNMDLYEWMLRQSKGKSDLPETEVAERDSTPREIKPKGFFIKNLFKKKEKVKRETITEDDKMKVEFN